MAFVEKLDVETSKAIHEIFGDTTVRDIKFYDTGERGYDHTYANVRFKDGHELIVSQGEERFEKILEIVQELDLCWKFHDDFIVDLVMPKDWRVNWAIEVDGAATVVAYDEADARRIATDLGSEQMELAWDFAEFRITSTKAADT